MPGRVVSILTWEVVGPGFTASMVGATVRGVLRPA